MLRTEVFIILAYVISGAVCTIISGPQNSTTVFGETAEFTCKTDTKKMYWFETSHVNVPLVIGFDGENELRNPDNPQKYAGFDLASPTQGTWILSIRFVNLTNEARYGCVDNIASRDYEVAILTVEVKGTLSIIPDAVSVSINESSVQDFYCYVYGSKPAVTMKWYIGTKEVDAAPDVVTKNDQTFNTSSKYSYTAHRSNNNESIYCEAGGQEVILPQKSNPVLLNILFPPGDVSFSCTYPSNETNNSIVECTCSATSNPESTYSFQRDGTDLSSNRFTVSQGCSEVTCIASNGFLSNGKSNESICPKSEPTTSVITTGLPTGDVVTYEPTTVITTRISPTTGLPTEDVVKYDTSTRAPMTALPPGGGSVGAVIGVVIGVIIILIIVAVIVVVMVCKKGDDKNESPNGNVEEVENAVYEASGPDLDGKTVEDVKPASGEAQEMMPKDEGLMYADLDHSNKPATNIINISEDATEYASVTVTPIP